MALKDFDRSRADVPEIVVDGLTRDLDRLLKTLEVREEAKYVHN